MRGEHIWTSFGSNLINPLVDPLRAQARGTPLSCSQISLLTFLDLQSFYDLSCMERSEMRVF